jgi:hypothetical protein
MQLPVVSHNFKFHLIIRQTAKKERVTGDFEMETNQPFFNTITIRATNRCGSSSASQFAYANAIGKERFLCVDNTFFWVMTLATFDTFAQKD